MAKRWTKDEETRMCKMLGEGATEYEVAQFLRRTRKAIEKRYREVLGNTKRKMLTEKMIRINREYRLSKMDKADA